MYLGIKDGIMLRFAQLAWEGQSQQMAVCLGEQDSSSSVEGQPQQMAMCLVEQDGRSSVLSLSIQTENSGFSRGYNNVQRGIKAFLEIWKYSAYFRFSGQKMKILKIHQVGSKKKFIGECSSLEKSYRKLYLFRDIYFLF